MSAAGGTNEAGAADRFPQSVDSPYIRYPDQLWESWLAEHCAEWERALGFTPTLDQRALFLAQAREDYSAWFTATVAPKNAAEQKRWLSFLSSKWDELRASMGSDPYLTEEQHVAWRAAQKDAYDSERTRLGKTIRGATSAVTKVLRDRKITKPAGVKPVLGKPWGAKSKKPRA